MKILALTVVACSLALPLGAQDTAREELRELTYAEESDQVLSHLVSLLPHARDAAQFEAALDRWVGDLDPADAVSVRHRIDQMFREVPDRELYGLLLTVVRHRFRTTPQQGPTGIASASSIGGPGNVNPPPLPYPAADFVTIGRVGGQLASAAGNCSQLQALSAELATVTCNTNYPEWGDQCRAARGQVADQLNQLLDAADC